MSTGSDRIESGGRPLSSEVDEKRSRLVLASYNIRYAVGSYLIGSGLLRKIGYNFPTDRAEAIAQNIQTAAKIFSSNEMMPKPDLLALQEANKATGRAGKHAGARAQSE